MTIPATTSNTPCRLEDSIVGMTWAGDSRHLAAAPASGEIAIVDTHSAQIVRRFPGHEGGNFRVAWHPSQNVLVTSGQDGRVCWWRPESGEKIREERMPTAWVEQLLWSPNGDFLASGSGKHVTIWDASGRLSRSISDHPSTVTGLSWNRAGTALATAAYGRVQLWEIEDGRRIVELPWKTSLISLAWSPDERWVVAGTQELAVQIWELPFKAGEELAMSGYAAKVRELAWHYSSRYLATGGGNDIMVWNCGGDGPAGTEPKMLVGHSQKLTSLDYQKNGHLLVSADSAGGVSFWNAKYEKPLKTHSLTGGVVEARWSPDDRKVAIGMMSGEVAILPMPT